MNILPKKRWHVRTKDNIARVRKDEAEAAEIEKEKVRRAKLAEQEARTAYLRSKVLSSDEGQGNHQNTNSSKSTNENLTSAKKIEADIYTTEGNINFFKDLELGKQTDGTNKEYEEEKKAEQEKYEKSIGYLTYLGQNSCEATGTKAWYELKSGSVAAYESDAETAIQEVGLKGKMKLDPINDIIKYTGLKPIKKSISVPFVQNETSTTERVNGGAKMINCEKRKLNEDLSDDGKPDKKHKKYKKRQKKKRKKDKYSKKKSTKNHRKKCKDKNSEVDKDKKRRRSDDDKVKHHTKRRKYSDSSSEVDSDDSANESGDLSSESIDEEEYQREKQKKLEVLRAERLKREAEERRRAERLLAGQKPDKVEEETTNKLPFQQKYSSQFNPHLARQNQEPKTLEAGVKYWLQ